MKIDAVDYYSALADRHFQAAEEMGGQSEARHHAWLATLCLLRAGEAARARCARLACQPGTSGVIGLEAATLATASHKHSACYWGVYSLTASGSAASSLNGRHWSVCRKAAFMSLRPSSSRPLPVPGSAIATPPSSRRPNAEGHEIEMR